MPSLRALIDSDIEVAAVVTNPDRPAGRGMNMQQSPVKEAAAAAGLEIIQVPKARDPALAERLRDLAPDVATVVAYGSILPGDLLRIPPRGFVNVHFSLLPSYRGAAPVQWAIRNGEKTTGVSIMVLTEGMDEGPVLAMAPEEIRLEDTTASLGQRLAPVGAELLVQTLPRYLAGELEPEAQDADAATYAPKLTTADAEIDWNDTSRRIIDLIRALDPEPGAWTLFNGTRVKIFRAQPLEDASLPPGEVQIDGGFVVGTSDGCLALLEVQPAGKKRMAGDDFARGLRLGSGARMGTS